MAVLFKSLQNRNVFRAVTATEPSMTVEGQVT